MDAKRTAIEIAQSMGFHRVVIGSLKPMEAERLEYEKWLAQGFAASMEYLKRNPHFRTSPQLLYPGSKCAIIVSVSYYTEKPLLPAPYFGDIARYAVGEDYHNVLTRKLNELRAKIESVLGRPILARAFTDDVQLCEQAYAVRHGLGFSGKNTMVIGPKLSGSYNFVAELFTDLDLEPDEAYQGTCGQCFRCGVACPTKAITDDGHVDANLCISFLTIENKNGIPLHLRKALGRWVFGCDICQEVCPYNQRPLETPWVEFKSGSGVGHNINLFEILAIDTQARFKSLFGHTPLSRPKRAGLIRNALVVLGNSLADSKDQKDNSWVEEARDRIWTFFECEANPMLREHAAWAISQHPDAPANTLQKMLAREIDEANKRKIEEYLGCL
ncbi:MAG: tRNA epoxyqueuosine(34) reductase QueG [Candidatus Obscuribacterales bacterium]|nr:tRNA epoxyqueuosine(34) reductase QueG [Candidatus Obscuribacterales bacterium]